MEADTMNGNEEEELERENHEMSISDERNEIKPIDAEVTHRICSGQVIVTLSAAVKELLENSLDAGAKSVEIRLVEYGSKVIEVKDNGVGISESNFRGLALKHHTSKLSQFEDLESIGTFGFRGEALSSLCALSNLSVTTRSEGSIQGFKIEYDSKGGILSQVAVARQVGTTVTLKAIFSPLPVRHKEFLKNLKREFHKLVNVLYGYAFVAKGVRISCTNETKVNTNPSSIICVPASQTPKERIASIFGSKQLASLIDIEEDVDTSEEILTEFGLTLANFKESQFKISGCISGPNSGRSSGDRQFYFLNSRPWDSPKISRLVNEVYHTFSRSQYPFICLNVVTKQENADVNVTPDKRVIYLQNEKCLLAKVKGTLLKSLMRASTNLPTSHGSLQTTLSFSSPLLDSVRKEEDVIPDEGYSSCPLTLTPTPPSPKGFDRQLSTSSNPQVLAASSNKSSKSVMSYLTKFKFGNNDKKGSVVPNPSLTSSFTRPNTKLKSQILQKPFAKQPKLMEFIQYKSQRIISSSQPQPQANSHCAEDDDDDVQILDGSEAEIEKENVTSSGAGFEETEIDFIESTNGDEGYSPLTLSQVSKVSSIYPDECDPKTKEHLMEQYGEEIIAVDDDDDENAKCLMENITLSLHWPSILDLSIKTKEKLDRIISGQEDRTGRKFRAKISPEDANNAESELKKELTKDKFKEMQLIGQFNLGFIITKLGSDLFIVDQHAADEKFNYEDLEKGTVLKGQRLIIPMSLQLPAVSENVLIENLIVFERNGFSFNIDKCAEPTKRVSLTTIPYSKSCQFGRQDVEELIFMLEDAPEKSFFRPMKVRTMLASRACRKSVMVGDKLSLKDMERVLAQLGNIEQPWNCPHGRPTLRHLFNLDLMPDTDWFAINS